MYIFFGILRILTNLISEIKVGFDKIEINDLFILLVFLIPFVAAIVLSKSLLNGWRHLYFIYPFIINCDFFQTSYFKSLTIFKS